MSEEDPSLALGGPHELASSGVVRKFVLSTEFCILSKIVITIMYPKIGDISYRTAVRSRRVAQIVTRPGGVGREASIVLKFNEGHFFVFFRKL